MILWSGNCSFVVLLEVFDIVIGIWLKFGECEVRSGEGGKGSEI